MNIDSAASVSRVIREEDALTIVWEDGEHSWYPHYWLRENAPENSHPLTGERLTKWGDSPVRCSPWSVCVEYDETLVVSWAGLKEINRFPLKELRNSAAIMVSQELALAAD